MGNEGNSPIRVIMAIIFLVILIVVVFSFMGGTSEELKSAGDSITDANNCSVSRDSASQALTYNISDGKCYNSTGGSPFTATQFDLPLSSLFGRGGIILLVMMAAILILLIVVLMATIKKRA